MNTELTGLRACAWGWGTFLFVVVALGAICPGCARFEAKRIEPIRRMEAFRGRTLVDAGLRAYLATNGLATNWPDQAWDFKALNMAAFYYHPDLDVARAKWATVKAGERT